MSALGLSVAAQLDALQQGRHGIRPVQFDGLKQTFLAAPVPATNAELSKLCKRKPERASRTSLLGIVAAQQCLVSATDHPELRTGLISGTSVGGMDVTEQFYRRHLEQSQQDFSALKLHDSGGTTSVIAESLGIHYYVNTISTACSSGANAIMQAARLIRAGKLDRVVAGGSDALTAFTISGFNSLMIYNFELCRPFDEHRNGLNLGEGAAYLLLESEESLKITGNTPLALISGWGNAADAFHQTATSPTADGAVKSMQKALAVSGIPASSIDYINAHGTGTKNNDLTESVAMQTIFGDTVPPFSSTKSFTGHTLAAAGAVEAVFSILALQEQCLFPNLHFTEPVSETGLIPQQTFSAAPVKTVLSNSFGFGGNCTSLIFSSSNLNS